MSVGDPAAKRQLPFGSNYIIIYLGDMVSTSGGCKAVVQQELDLGGLSFGNMASCYVERVFL